MTETAHTDSGTANEGYAVPVWQSQQLLRHILSGESAKAIMAQAELDRRRLAVEAQSQKFREEHIAGEVRTIRRRLRRRQAFRGWAIFGLRACLLFAALPIVA